MSLQHTEAPSSSSEAEEFSVTEDLDRAPDLCNSSSVLISSLNDSIFLSTLSMIFPIVACPSALYSP